MAMLKIPHKGYLKFIYQCIVGRNYYSKLYSAYIKNDKTCLSFKNGESEWKLGSTKWEQIKQGKSNEKSYGNL